MTVAANPGCAADRDASTEKHRQDWLCHKIQEFVFPMELIDSHAHIDFPQFA